MGPLQRPLDKDGFPIPVGFDDGQPEVDRRARATRFLRGTLILVGVGLLLGTLVKLQAGKHIAAWYSQRAEQRYLADDLRGALADADRALAWQHEQPEAVYFQRARYRQEAGDLTGSLEDYNELIRRLPSFPGAYVGRSIVYQRLKRHREAIDDLTRAIELRPAGDHVLLNHRAYTRAIARLELEEALEDIERAIDMAGYENAAYLDTRGYIYLLLGRDDDALADLERAVELAAKEREELLAAARGQQIDERRMARIRRRLDENDAVIVHHRGLAYEKVGRIEQAKADLQRAQELGYDPAQGVY